MDHYGYEREERLALSSGLWRIWWVWSVGVQAVEETVEGRWCLGAGLFWVSRVGDVEGGFVHYR